MISNQLLNFAETNHPNLQDCDILSVAPVHPYPDLNVPQYVMDIKELESINVKRSMPQSYCLILQATVTNSSMISVLSKFASVVVNKDKRIGLVLELGQGINLSMVNSTRLPYIIAGQLEEGSEQFLCPTVGSNLASLKVCELEQV